MRAIVFAMMIGCGGAKHVEPAKETCDPGRCLEDIARVMKENRSDMRSCYELAQAQRNELAGRLTLHFVIDPKGDVIETSPSSRDGEIEDAELFECVSAVVMRVKFAASPSGKRTRAYHVFEFKRP